MVGQRMLNRSVVVSRHDLPMWLASEIANQRRVDLTTAGVSVASSDVASPPTHFQHDPAAVGIEILMPNEDRKQAKWARLVHHTKGAHINYCYILRSRACSRTN